MVIKAMLFDSGRRHYTLILRVDLLDDIFVERHWGGNFNKRGGFKKDKFETMEEAKLFFDQIAKRRQRRGYQSKFSIDENTKRFEGFEDES